MTKALIIEASSEPYLRKDFKFAAVGQEEDIQKLQTRLETFDSVVVERTDYDDETYVSVAATEEVFNLLEEDLTDLDYTFDPEAFDTI